MSTYSQLKALQNFDCDCDDYDYDCNDCALYRRNNGYNICCSFLSEEQLKEIAYKIDAKERVLLPAEEVPLNKEETSLKEKHKHFDKITDHWKDFKYNIRVLTIPDASYRPIMSKMEFSGIPLTKLYTNCIIENINGYGIGMVWITTEDGALLYIPWDMIVSIHPIGEKE